MIILRSLSNTHIYQVLGWFIGGLGELGSNNRKQKALKLSLVKPQKPFITSLFGLVEEDEASGSLGKEKTLKLLIV